MKLAILLLFIVPAVILAQERIAERRPPRPPPDEEIDTRVIPESVFTVVAPYDIRRGKPYNIYVRGFNIRRTTRLEIRISGKSDAGASVNIRRTVVLSRDSSRGSVRINTSNIVKGSYILSVEGGNVSEKRTLTYFTKNVTFLLQLSKAIFLPGDLLQFRVFAVDSETKSVNPTGPSTLSISDPKGNLITSFSNVTFRKGKFENQFQLSSKASLGIWNVQFQYQDESVSKKFEVSEYQLPLIDAKLTISQTTPFSFQKVPVTVDVSYTFGGDADGTASVNIAQNGNNVFKKTVTLSGGTATFDLDIVNDLKVTPGQYRFFEATLTFEDALTGLKVTDTKSFSVIPNAYSIISTADSNFKPGSPFKFTLTMRKYDGSPAPAGTKLQVIPENPNTIPQQTLTLGSDGTVSSSVNVPAGSQYISLRVTAKNSEDGYVSGSIWSRPTGSFLSLEVLTQKPNLKEPVKLKLTSGEQVDFVMVHIVSKGVLLDSFRVWFDEDSNEDKDPNTVNFSFKPSFKYAPAAQVIAYYINKKGNFVTTQAYVELNNDLPNYLKIEPQTDQVKPGSIAKFGIESYVDSTVSLVAVDQRVLLLRSGANFTKQNVFEDLQRYNWNNVIYDWQNIADYEYSFGGVGLFIFTNIPRPVRKFYPRPMRPEAREREASPARPGGSGSNGVTIRQDFREVFLWRDVDIDHYLYEDADGDEYYYGIETISEKVPESITTYLIYGVSMSRYDGLGLTDNLPSITVFLPFFLSVEFPFSIKRNEVLVQDIFLFNYLKQSQTVEVKITKDSKYNGVDLVKYGWKDSNGFFVKTITTKVGQNMKLQFALKPKVLGFASFEITVKGPLAGDGLKKPLRIIPEGVPRSMTKSVFIAIEKSSVTVNELLQCDLPDSAYQDTTEISSTVVGDIFGKTLNNLDKLIQMPGGCGEQTMLTLAPNIAIYGYLKAANKLTPTLKTTLENYILAGYQNELKYQRSDGSFSAFGDSDPSGSTWLTAYVGQYFYFAKDMVTIDSNVIKRAAEFVKQQQNTDGSFKEPGRVIHTDMQGGSGNGIALTAYCALFFTFILPGYPEYTTVRNNAIQYLENNLSTFTSTYDLGVIAYALQLAGSSKASEAYDSFYAKRTEKPTTISWQVPIPPSSGWWYNQPRSLDTEATSYGLLNVLKKDGSMTTVLKIVKFILGQSNSFGGYSSSQDTVMALYALSQFARKFTLNNNVDLTLTPNVGSAITAKVDSTNAFTVQNFELNPGARKLNVKATSSSSGLAIVSLICNFYEDPTKVVPSFKVTYKNYFGCTYRISFDACASYIPSGSSNMAIMTVNLPSGFIYNEWWGSVNPDVSQTEVSNQGSTVTFYFNSFTNAESCVTVNTYRSKFVAELKDGTIIVNDYYNTALEGMASYPVGDLSNPCYFGRRF